MIVIAKWWKKIVDLWMRTIQCDPDVPLEEWKQTKEEWKHIKAEYKAQFGQTYIRPKQKNGNEHD